MIHKNLAFVLLGKQRAGKSQLLRYIAAALAYAYNKEKMQVWRRDSIDVLKDIQHLVVAGDYIIIDEFDPGSAHLIKSDVNTIKAFFDLDGNSNVASRHNDSSLTGGVLRGVTSNAMTVEEYYEKLPKNGSHLSAVMERACYCVFEEDQWASECPPDSVLERGIQAQMTMPQAESDLNMFL